MRRLRRVAARGHWRALHALTVLVGLASCREVAPSTVTVAEDEVALAHMDSLWTGPGFIGTVSSQRILRVRAEAPGTLVTVPVSVGQEVAAGALMAVFDDRSARERIQVAQAAEAQAEAQLTQATRELGRVRALVDIGAVAPKERDVAERLVLAARSHGAEARAQRSFAERALQQTVIRAPFAAVVMDPVARTGDVVAAGMPLFILADTRQRIIEASLPTAVASSLTVGATVRIMPVDDASADRSRVAPVASSARITSISRVVDPQTQQVRVSISVPTDGSRLLLGQTVSGRISLEGRASMLIPERAVDRTTDTAMVAILRQGRVVRMAVALGQRIEDTHHIEVVSGLTSGDSILVGEARRLATGTIVQSRRR